MFPAALKYSRIDMNNELVMLQNKSICFFTIQGKIIEIIRDNSPPPHKKKPEKKRIYFRRMYDVRIYISAGAEMFKECSCTNYYAILLLLLVYCYFALFRTRIVLKQYKKPTVYSEGCTVQFIILFISLIQSEL